jgi:ComF family protein
LSLGSASAWLTDGLYPIYCLGCQKEGGFLCRECETLVFAKQTQHCMVCKKISPNGKSCSYCKKISGVSRWLSFSSLHTGIARTLIHSFKYENKLDLGQYLGKQAADLLSSQGVAFEDYIVCFMPMSWQRFWHRPYNQAEVLARIISKQTGAPMVDILGRRHRPRQVELSGRARRNNLSGSFYAKFPLFDQRIILVDDVVTTGATMTAAAAALKQAGAREILALSIV